MEKKKSNPFHIFLILVTLLVGGGLLGFGFMKKKEFDEKKDAFKTLSRDLRMMESMEEYPSEETVEKLKTSLVSYKGKIEGLRNALKTSSVSEFKNIPSGKFATELEKVNSEIKSLYKEKEITLPTNWYLGFEKYTNVPAPKNATGELNYQLESLKWLHETLAKHNPSALNNLYRKPLPSEVAGAEEVSKAGQHVSLPMELTFTAYEEDARAFLSELVKSSKYLFTLDTVKFKLLPAEVADTTEAEVPEEEGSSDDAFDNIFEIDETDSTKDDEVVEEEPDVLSEDKLFNQVLGQERVAVFIDLNLVYLTSQEPLPEVVKSK